MSYNYVTDTQAQRLCQLRRAVERRKMTLADAVTELRSWPLEPALAALLEESLVPRRSTVQPTRPTPRTPTLEDYDRG